MRCGRARPSRASSSTDADGKWQVGQTVAVEVTKLPLAEAEVYSAEAMGSLRDAGPAQHLVCDTVTNVFIRHLGVSSWFIRARSEAARTFSAGPPSDLGQVLMDK